MSWKNFSITKVILGIFILIIGLILKFPMAMESLPLQYGILGLIFTEAQYSVINIISYIIIILSIIYFIVLVINRK